MQGNVQVQRISSGCFGNNLELSFVSIFCMHVGAVKVDARAMLISRFASLLASACSMDIAEFIRMPGQGGTASDLDITVGSKTPFTVGF